MLGTLSRKYGFKSLLNVPIRSITKNSAFPTLILPIVKYDSTKGYHVDNVNTADYLKNKKVVIVGFPGAFTPTCSSKHLPGFIASKTDFKTKGYSEVIALSVNDPFVATAYAEKLSSKEAITFIADGNGELTKKLDMSIELDKGYLGLRCKRFVLLVNNNKIEEIFEEESTKLTEKTSARDILDRI